MDDHENRTDQSMTIKPDLAKRIQEELGQNVYLCYQCVKCTSGCPVANFFDWQPNQIMRAVQLGQEDIALQSETPWLCASCQTCTTRCPQGLDIAAIMDFLTAEAKARGFKPSLPELNVFNEAFMREVKFWGRSYEPGLMVEMTLRNRNLKALMDDAEMYLKMMQKGKVGFFPHPTRMPSKRNIKPVPGAEKAIAYYPGCSLESTATEFDESTRAVAEALGMNLVEPEGWVCCGSSPAHRADPDAALRLPMENLALIEKSGFKEVTMPCAACFNRHKAAQYEIRQHEEAREKVDQLLDYEYQDSVHVSTVVGSHVEIRRDRRTAQQSPETPGGVESSLLLRLPAHPPPAGHPGHQPRKPHRHGRIDGRLRCRSPGLVLQDHLLWGIPFRRAARYRRQAQRRHHPARP